MSLRGTFFNYPLRITIMYYLQRRYLDYLYIYIEKMPLYRRRVKKSLLSQDVPATNINTPISNSVFKHPSSSHRSDVNFFGSQETMKSPIYPEVLPRNASEPNESAFDGDGFGSENLDTGELGTLTPQKSYTANRKSKKDRALQEITNLDRNYMKGLSSGNIKMVSLTDKINQSFPRGNSLNNSLIETNNSLLDNSLNSSLSSQVSINHPPVKEAYKKFKRINTPKCSTHYDKMKWLQQQRNVGVYVHCDKCDKIWYLEEIQDPTMLPDKWYCRDNTDQHYNRCDIPEEKFPLHVQEDWIDNLYNAGSIVWGKVEGYPWWPGIVDDDPDTASYYWLDDDISKTPSSYHVTFFDQKEVTRAWLKPKDLKSFRKEIGNRDMLRDRYRKFKNRIDFALKQAEEASKLSLSERLEKFSFLSRYKKFKKPRDVSKESKRKNTKFDKAVFSKNKESNNCDQEKGDKKRQNKNFRTESSEFLLDDFEIPTAPTIENFFCYIFKLFCTK